jgi:hypothetical protein
MNTLRTYQSGATVSWENAELAVYLVYLYGELQKIPRGTFDINYRHYSR